METRKGAREEISLAYENRKQTVKGRERCWRVWAYEEKRQEPCVSAYICLP